MFDKTKRNGLTGRLLHAAGLPTGNMAATFAVAPIAMANYPKGAEIPILPPRIDQNSIWAATEAFVDSGVGTLDDLYQKIWGLSMEQYDDKMG